MSHTLQDDKVGYTHTVYNITCVTEIMKNHCTHQIYTY